MSLKRRARVELEEGWVGFRVLGGLYAESDEEGINIWKTFGFTFAKGRGAFEICVASFVQGNDLFRRRC